MRAGRLCLAAMALSLAALPVRAEGEAEYTIVIENHVFAPVELKVPAGATIVLTVDNRDITPEEFESPELKVEKIIPGGMQGKVRFGPLSAGSYLFYGEFNMKTARGVVTAE
jgi:hypothetical protein